MGGGQMIDHIRKITWTQPSGEMGYCYHVYYKGKGWRKGRHFIYSYNQNLPSTVVSFLVDEKTKCETIYEKDKKIETIFQ